VKPPAPPLPDASDAEAQAITDQATALRDVYDALSDLALAEGVHQAVQGNFDRIASASASRTGSQSISSPASPRPPGRRRARKPSPRLTTGWRASFRSSTRSAAW
jgi:hypothetical protein